MPMLRREVAAINLDTFEQGGELPPPTPLSATASFGVSLTWHESHLELQVIGAAQKLGGHFRRLFFPPLSHG